MWGTNRSASLDIIDQYRGEADLILFTCDAGGISGSFHKNMYIPLLVYDSVEWNIYESCL